MDPMDTETTASTSDLMIEFTSVPAYGSFHNLRGMVRNVDAARMRVAVYIRVHGSWWTKPYWDSPATSIATDSRATASGDCGSEGSIAGARTRAGMATPASPPSAPAER